MTPMTSLDSGSEMLEYEARGSVLIVRFNRHVLPAEMDLTETREELEAAVARFSPQTMIFDLDKVPTLSSSSISVLFGLHRAGIAVRIYRPTPTVREVIRITQLQQLFPQVDELPPAQ